MPDHSSPKFDPADEEVTRYHAISSLAVAGLLAGLFAPLAMLAAVLWAVPLLAVVVSALALRRIADRRPDLSGRPAALVGLLLGTVFLVAAPVADQVYDYFLRQQARQFAATWIDAVRQGEVYRAHHLMLPPKYRLPLGSRPSDFYRNFEQQRRMLRLFVNEPAPRTLFALGPRATIRFYETASQGRQEGADIVQQTYAVTYHDQEKQPKFDGEGPHSARRVRVSKILFHHAAHATLDRHGERPCGLDPGKRHGRRSAFWVVAWHFPPSPPASRNWPARSPCWRPGPGA